MAGRVTPEGGGIHGNVIEIGTPSSSSSVHSNTVNPIVVRGPMHARVTAASKSYKGVLASTAWVLTSSPSYPRVNS